MLFMEDGALYMRRYGKNIHIEMIQPEKAAMALITSLAITKGLAQAIAYGGFESRDGAIGLARHARLLQ